MQTTHTVYCQPYYIFCPLKWSGNMPKSHPARDLWIARYEFVGVVFQRGIAVFGI